MYKARLKRGKKIVDYFQAHSLQEAQERFNGRLLEADESFELLWFTEMVYLCPGGETIDIQDRRNEPPSSDGVSMVEPEISPESSVFHAINGEL